MRDEDMEELQRCMSLWWEKIGYVKDAIICTPDVRELRLIQSSFSGVNVRSYEVKDWNLNDPADCDSDLVLASHVFMCATDPAQWIRNACKRTRFFIMLDLAVGYRGGPEGELSPSTGDVMRYCKPPEMVAMFPGAYDLNLEGHKLVDLRQFEYPSACGVEGYEKAKLFVALFKGDL